ncbi:low temperature requirement protein LtrA [Micromonospora pisi]|uniref:Low temperature requirement protein LtrA n=1 Tax=Micromonospora pisi TaxID=589240 RepID=A0A495JHE4_9ACTN|nr:low temperature requirement protein A [Micromonospora pisi]RKR87814.1 low temperature requirement protein LtrA [Micromonospora pisi]
MTNGEESEPGVLRSAENSQRATFLELFFDLVFVFALTRISQRLITDFTDRRSTLLSEAGQTLLLFLALWLVWTFTALVTSRLDPDQPAIQLVVVGTMFGAMVMAVAVPKGFGEHAVIFAVAYLALHLGRTLFLFLVHRRDRDVPLRLFIWLGLSAVPWLFGAINDDAGLRAVLWTIAILLDYGGAVAGWPIPKLGPAPTTEIPIAGEHLAERYQQFLLITLGESILVIGLTFSGASFAVDRTTTFLISFLTTVLLWRVYFHQAGHLLPVAITTARQPARFGRSMSFSHLFMIAGIVLTAVGYELSITHPLEHTSPVWLYTMLGGPALFLAGRAQFEYQVFARVSRSRIGGLIALVLLTPAMLLVPPLAVSSAAAAVLAAVALADALRSRRRTMPEAPTPPT